MNKNNKNIGKIGEETACMFLMKQGYQIVARNYWKKWGEIDIVALKGKTTHFVEVKTVSKSLQAESPINCGENRGNLECPIVSRENCKEVSCETTDEYRPEDNIHPWKLKRLSRVIQTYLAENNTNDDNWQFDAVTVF